MPHNLKTIYTG